VVVSTVIDHSDFKSDFRGNECRMDRAVLIDASDERINTGGQDPDENVTDFSFDLN
jgi:hypothetical protein